MRRGTIWALLATGAALAGLYAMLGWGLSPMYMQLSGSAPKGVWIQTFGGADAGPLSREEWVVACVRAALPVATRLEMDSGWDHARGCVRVMKRVWVDVRDGRSRVMVRHGALRRTPDGMVLAARGDMAALESILDSPRPGEQRPIWLYSPHPDSFDSRYFGPVSADEIVGRALPLWTWR